MSQNKDLYESPLVWDQALQLGQKNLVAAIRDFFPPGVGRVLDVGCGDGKVTEALIQALGRPIIGLDFSEEALSRCSFETIQGDASNLPFPDRDFDLVLSIDMLEHLPADLEERAWQQLFRVAAKAVLVAVPFRENLLDATAHCHHCGYEYHVNWHMRAYDFGNLLAKAPPGWVVDKVVLSGEAWPPFPVLETRFRRNVLNEWSGWAGAFCPACSAPGREAGAPAAIAGLAAVALGEMIYADPERARSERFHSEIILLYRRQENAAWQTEVPAPVSDEVRSAGRARIPGDGILANLQPYPQHARLVRGWDGGIVAQLPVYGETAELMFTGGGPDATEVQLVLEDGLGLVYEGAVRVSSEVPTRLALPRPLVTSYYGVLLHLPEGAPPLDVSVGVAVPGHRLVPDVAVAGYLADRYGEIPLYLQVTEPIWLDDRCFTGESGEMVWDWAVLFERINARHQAVVEGLRHEEDRLRLALAQSGQEKSVLESRLGETQSRLAAANAELATLWARREVRAAEHLRRWVGKSHLDEGGR